MCDEELAEQRAADVRRLHLEAADEPDRMRRRSIIERYYSMEELDEVEFGLNLSTKEQPPLPRKNSLIDTGHGPWGISGEKDTGSENAWGGVDTTTYSVRGPTYLQDHRKVPSETALGELRVLDLFRTEVDIENVSANEGVKTVQRLRGEGETRELIVLNLRVGQLGAVAVWALPELSAQAGPGRALLERFKGAMTDAERNKRFKVIPRLREGPKLIRMLVGDNTPAILAKQIPVSYFVGDDRVFEVSVNITESPAAKRISNMMVGQCQRLDVEMAVLIEAQESSELPEQLLGAFRAMHADLSTTRILMKDEVTKKAPEAQRPGFLPST